MTFSGSLPPALAAQAAEVWQRVLERADTAVANALTAHADSGPYTAEIPFLLATSQFIAEQAARHPDLLLSLLDSGELDTTREDAAFSAELSAALSEPDADLYRVLRLNRQRQMLRILWRDFTRRADTFETVRDTSLLAEASLRVAQDHLMAELVQRFGTPRGRHTGDPQQLVVIGMGKLGARELNVSSDIDLIFSFPEAGQTDGERCISNEEFFVKLGQKLIQALDQVTVDGFVFRVDMRLRPYGDSGALVHNFTALEEYYQDQGRDWERYALVKGRPLTGDPAAGQRLEQMLLPFVYRRYVDFGVIESLRSMKQMISSEVRRRGLQDNVKLGHGGIREVEFIVQCFQLIRGGRDLGLQTRSLTEALAECVRLNCLPPSAADELLVAYGFLRDSEHAIQGYADQQTQELPSTDLPRLALAAVMGCADWDAYRDALEAHRNRVSRHFSALIADPEDEEPAPVTADLWGPGLDVAALLELGFADPEASLERLVELRESRRVTMLQAEGAARLGTLIPQLLCACAGVDHPDLALERILPMVVAVLRRSAYLVLLSENPQALAELVRLCEASPRVADQLAQQPVLLDELLDRASLYSAPDKQALQSELTQQVQRLSPTDLEAQMDALRYFKSSHVLRVAASELGGILPLKQVSDKLTFIAEVILDQCIVVAWANLTAKYGEPQRDGDGSGFAVLGYGKLGGIELGYGSDLDLVFLYDAARNGVTDGPRSIDNSVFYTRLGQRIIHILETRTAQGQIYEVDMRLRPSGESGMLVTSLSGFAGYQKESAWTWEHQALVRARYVAGDARVAEQAEQLRREILCARRDTGELAIEVVKMRQRMRQHLLPAEDPDGDFHLKQGRGGIVDIEFLVQYAVLAWAAKAPELAHWSDNVRILETLADVGRFSPERAESLTEAYLALRSASHQLALQDSPAIVSAEHFGEERSQVIASWESLLGDVVLTQEEGA